MADQVPSALSVRDPSYDHKVGNRLAIFLDGVEQSRVIAYDTSKGYVWRYATDSNGLLIPDGDSMREETVHGAVAVEWKD